MRHIPYQEHVLSTETVARPTSARFHQAAALALIIALVAAASITMNRSAAQFTDTTDSVTVDATAGGVDINITDEAMLTYTVDNIGPGWTDTFDVEVSNDSTVALPTDLTDIGITGTGTAVGADPALMGHLQVEVVRDGDTVNPAYTGGWDAFVTDHATFGDLNGADVWQSTNVLATNPAGVAETSTYTFNLSYPEDAAISGSAGFSFQFDGLQVVEDVVE